MGPAEVAGAATGCPLAALADLAGVGAAGTETLPFTSSVFGLSGLASGLRALLEMTNRRRAGGVLALAGLSLRRLSRDALFGAVTLRFNIKISDRENRFRFIQLGERNSFHAANHDL
jgi:hypothetical protein